MLTATVRSMLAHKVRMLLTTASIALGVSLLAGTLILTNTMGIAFILEGIAIALFLHFRADPLMFVILSGLVFLGWGEIFSLFPSTLTDTFGTEHTTPEEISKFCADLLNTSVKGIIDGLDLRRPIYRDTAAYGHFGRDEFPWEAIKVPAKLAEKIN